MEEKRKNYNTLVAAIGLSLLLLVVFLTFLRPVFQKKITENTAGEELKNMPELSAPKITLKELFQKLSEKEPLNIFDIRASDDFQKEHLKNSKNVSPENVGNLLEKDTFYIFVDNGDSGQARNLAAGFKDNYAGKVFYLDGGFQAWKDSNFPTISEGNPNSIIDQSKVSFISLDNLKTAMEKEEKSLLIIDVRNSDIFSFEHLKNAVNIPLSDIEKREKEITFGKKIIVYDNNGKLSFQAAVRLFDLNILNTYILSGGLDAWKSKNYEIIH